MIRRLLLVLCVMVLAWAGRGQSCFMVLDAASGAPIPGALAVCGDGTLGAIADGTGRICLARTCERLEVRASSHTTQRLATAEVLIAGAVYLEPLARGLAPAIIEPWPRVQDRQALAAMAAVDSSLLAGFERSGLRSAVQWQPGVQWDERGHGGSQRLSIRGSLLRSAFGVRGVKVYWGPLPITLADGSTPLELLDPVVVGSVDVVRSVGSPAFGTAPSGLLLVNAPFRADSGMDATIEANGGSYGFYRLGAAARSNDGRNALAAGVVRQRNDGYRAQEWSARDQAFVATRFARERSTTRVFVTWQSASWALPGSLDEATAEQDPRSARPYSTAIDAHLDKQQLLGGIANDMRLNQWMHVRSTVHAQVIDKKNPYGTSAANCGYKDEKIRAAGARLALGGEPRLFDRPFAWEVGLEALFERDQWLENTYVDGVIGALKVDADTRVANLNAFATTTTRIGLRTTVHLGVGTERTGYDHEDHLTERTDYRAAPPALLPYMAIEQRFKTGIALRMRYAESVSRPTVWELLGTSGTFNADLHGEEVREWELAAANTPTAPVSVDVVGFHRMITGMIVQRANADNEPGDYVNADDATITGGELRVQGSPFRNIPERLSLLWSVSAQATDVRMVEPSGQEHDQGEIPGTPMLSTGLILNGRLPRTGAWGWETGVRINSSTAASLNGTTGIPGYHVEHLRLLYDVKGRSYVVSAFIHVENLLDARYNSWVQVNDPGGRYYNPAPGRSFFGGVRLTLGSRRAPKAD